MISRASQGLAEPERGPSGPGAGREWLQYAAFVALLFAAKLWLIATYGNGTPFWDQWDGEAAYLYKPLLDGTLRFADLLAPHNEHRIFTTKVLALMLLRINGIWNPFLQMVVNAAVHVGTLLVLIALLSRTLGRQYRPVLLLFALVLFAVPYAWENTLGGFHTTFYLVILFSVATIWLTVTEPPLSIRWWLGVACSVLAFLSMASGIMALAASCAVALTLYGLGVRRTNQQLIAAAVLAGLFAAGYLATPAQAQHATLRADSVGQFGAALVEALSWPAAGALPFMLLVSAPIVLLVATVLRKPPTQHDRRWILLALVVWGVAQIVSLAYGRAVGVTASRYLDLLAVAVLVNFGCALSLARTASTANRRKVHGLVGVWSLVILVSLVGRVTDRIPPELVYKRYTGELQESNTRSYLATGDIAHLKNKPFRHIPYPHAERLAVLLDDAAIRSILPANIRPKVQHVDRQGTGRVNRAAGGTERAVGRLDAATRLLLRSYPFFVLAGLVLSVIAAVQLRRSSVGPPAAAGSEQKPGFDIARAG